MKKTYILITGATSGLGVKTALILAIRGKRLIVHGRKTEIVKKISKKMMKAGASEVLTFIADLSSLKESNAAITKY